MAHTDTHAHDDDERTGTHVPTRTSVAGSRRAPSRTSLAAKQTRRDIAQRNDDATRSRTRQREAREQARTQRRGEQSAGTASGRARGQAAGQHSRKRQQGASGSRQRAQDARGRYDTSNYTTRDAPARARARHRRRAAVLKYVACGIVVVAVVVAVALVNPFAGTSGDEAGSSGSVFSGSSGSTGSSEGTESVSLPTPIMAEYDGIYLHSAVAMENLTEILIHNASYDYALPVTTQLEEATNTEVMEAHGTGRIASEQPTGDEWMTGYFIRCYRSGNAGPKLSAIDCGGAAGTTVYAPVSGTVLLVKEYLLYDEYDDYQIHIQPEGRSDVDVVLIHVQNVCVEAGDTVTAGVTEIAEIRDVYAYIGDSMQLKDYTAEDDDGNHTHIQVNDVTNEDYHGLDDLYESEDASADE